MTAWEHYLIGHLEQMNICDSTIVAQRIVPLETVFTTVVNGWPSFEAIAQERSHSQYQGHVCNVIILQN